MFFKDVIGQEEAKQRLVNEVKEGRIPHARLFCGPEGTGKLPLAIAYAQYLCCENRGTDDACGVCPSCVKFHKLVHPDLHFAFPIIKKKTSKDTVCDDFLADWRAFVLQNPYFNLNHWLQAMGAENQQAQIFAKESDEITRKLSLKASQGNYKVMLIWLPEKMNTECSNKLLKLLEEPPAGTVFLLVSEEPDALLQTIQSRTQRFNLPGIGEEELAATLQTGYGLQAEDAADIARRAEGSYLNALEAIHLNEENQQFFELFVNLMRLSYQRKIREIKQWSETVAAMGRERQKHFLTYCQRMIRENFMYNFHRPDLVYMNPEEQKFSTRFAPFVNERNVTDIINELTEAQRHIEQNVNPKMVFFDFSLKLIVLLINKN